MEKTNTKKMGTGVALVVAIMSFGAFAALASIITNNQSQITAVSLADDSNDSGDSNDDGDNKDDQKDEDKNDDSDKNGKENESVKKQAERQREDAKKQLERSNKGSENDDDSDDDSSKIGDTDGDMEDTEDVNGDDNGMFKDRAKTLSKLQEEIAKARENISEKQAEGADVTAALARLALAEAGIVQVGSSFDANNLEAAKELAKEIKKEAHFTEKDLEFAKKTSEAVADVQKRFGQVDKKIATLEFLGGDASVFKTQLASIRQDFSVLQASISDAITRDTVRAFEKRVKLLKSLVESSIFAFGETEDDDLIGDHRESSDDLFEDLDDVAEIEDGDDNGISGKLRKISAEHKASVQGIEDNLKDIKGRDGVARVILGPDFNALDGLNAEITAMNTRADALTQASTQITDPQIKQILVDQVTALRSEALKFQAYISSENNQFSILGKFLALFR